MGNYCTHNFQNIKDEEVVVSQVDRARLSHSPSEPKLYEQRGSYRPIDQEAIHSIVRRQEPVVHIVEQEEQKMHFPPEPQVVSISSAHPQRVRQRLEELDLSFYHSLGLPDYEYQPIPEADQPMFNGVQTYELKDNYGVKYVGQWLNNHIHGNGVLLSNTSKYIGQFKFGLKHYHGRQILKNEVYQGQFQGGRRKGLGIRYTPTQTERGYFQDELQEGDILYLDGRTEHRTKKNGMNLMQELRQPQDNKSLGSLFTDKYYDASELPVDWYEENELERVRAEREGQRFRADRR